LKKLYKAVLVSAIMASAGASLPAFSSEQTYKEGVHYLNTGDKRTEKPEVKEYFSLFCPHCFSLEPHLKKVKEGLGDAVLFKRSHVNFMGLSKPVQNDLTISYIHASEQGKGDAFVDFMFNRIHREGKSVKSRVEVENSLSEFGYSKDEIASIFNSGALRMKQSMVEKRQDILVSKKILDGVPSLIVNGKYKIEFNKLSKTATLEDLENLILFLSEKD